MAPLQKKPYWDPKDLGSFYRSSNMSNSTRLVRLKQGESTQIIFCLVETIERRGVRVPCIVAPIYLSLVGVSCLGSAQQAMLD